jgi:hypothetical protein
MVTTGASLSENLFAGSLMLYCDWPRGLNMYCTGRYCQSLPLCAPAEKQALMTNFFVEVHPLYE